MPSLPEATDALARRMLILQFTRSFVGNEDWRLKEKLEGELSGIANWALEGLCRLREQGRFTVPTAMQKVVSEFRRTSSPILAFIEDCLIVENRLNDGNLQGVETTNDKIQCLGKEVYDAYRDWRDKEGLNGEFGQGTCTANWFWRSMRADLPKLESKPNTRGEGKVYFGIALKGSAKGGDKEYLGAVRAKEPCKGCGGQTLLTTHQGKVLCQTCGLPFQAA
jgi:putative DNA primase/helicase